LFVFLQNGWGRSDAGKDLLAVTVYRKAPRLTTRLGVQEHTIAAVQHQLALIAAEAFKLRLDYHG
jgi:hypothetical protein